MDVLILQTDIDRVLGNAKVYSNVVFFDHYFKGMNIYSNVQKRKEGFIVRIAPRFLDEQEVRGDKFYLSKNKRFSLFQKEGIWIFKEQVGL